MYFYIYISNTKVKNKTVSFFLQVINLTYSDIPIYVIGDLKKGKNRVGIASTFYRFDKNHTGTESWIRPITFIKILSF